MQQGLSVPGEQTRTQDIVKKPQQNGRECPTALAQTKPCFLQGCYRWNVSEWTACTSQAGLCGYGTQTRNVTCVSSSGQTVNASNCLPDLNITVLPVCSFLVYTKLVVNDCETNYLNLYLSLATANSRVKLSCFFNSRPYFVLYFSFCF